MNMKKLNKLAVFCTVVINIPIIFGDINDDRLNEILNHNKQKLDGFNFDAIKKHGLRKISEDNFNEAKDQFVQYLTDKDITITSNITSVEKTSHRSCKCVNYFWGCSDEKKCGIRFFYDGTIHLGEFTADKNKNNTLLKKFMPKIIDCIDGLYAKKTTSGGLNWYKIGESAYLNVIRKKVNTISKNVGKHSKKMVSNTLSGVNRLVNNGTNMVSKTLSVANNGINDIYNKTNRALKAANAAIEFSKGVHEGFNSVQKTNDTNEEHQNQNQNQNTGSNQRCNNERPDVMKEKGFMVGQWIGGIRKTMDDPNIREATSEFANTYEYVFGDVSLKDRINSMTTGMKIYGICCRCKW